MPGIQVGVLVLKNLKNQRKYTAVDQLLRGVCAQRKNELKNDTRNKQIQALFNAAREGNMVLPEAQLLESNIKKIGRAREINSPNNLYALIHYLGLKYLVPVFAYDLDTIGKDIHVDFIETKQGKRPEDIELSPETRHAVIWFINLGSQTKEDFTALPDEFINLIGKYCGGSDANIYILDADNTEADLDYESELEKELKEQASQNQEENTQNEQESIGQARSRTDNNESSTSETTPETEQPPFLKEDTPKKVSNEPATTKDQITQILERAVNKLLNERPENAAPQLEMDVETPSDPTHGDYSSSIALKLSKTLQKAPHEIANLLIQKIEKPDSIEKIEIAGPGFINFYLSANYLMQALKSINSLKTKYGRLGIGHGTKTLVEYSSPNIAKPLGVHHLLSTIIGQTIANMFKFAGYDTVTLNWPGDWGTQFGKLIYAYKTWGSEEEVKKDPLNELLKLYVKFHEEEEKNPELVEKGREEFKKLEEGDDENGNIWEWFRDISIKELERIYQKLGVGFDEYLGERMYLEDAKEIIKEGVEKGIIREGEKGALIVKFENDMYPPSMLQKADGTTLYASRDLASLKDRIVRLKGDKIVYVVDVAQKLHLEQLFETARMFNWGDAEFKHVIFGRMQLPEGKMSTRKGDVILLDEVLKEALNRTKKIVAEKSRELSDEEKNHIAEKMAVSAIKYNIVSQNPETNITFDWDKMLSLEGNSGPYLEYSYARAKSILRKADEETEIKPASTTNDRQTDLFSLTKDVVATKSTGTAGENAEKPYSHQSEQRILHMLPRFPDVIEQAVKEYKPNLISNYLFDLARAFNSFYNEVHVLTAATEELKESRLKLVEAFAQVLQNGLTVLGIDTFERM